MQDKNGHLSAQQILLLLDGELNPADALRAEKHLEVCEQCNNLLTATKTTLADLNEIHLKPTYPALSSEGPRALLKARLREMQGQANHTHLWPSLFYAAAILLLAGASLITWQRTKARRPAASLSALDRPVPNPSLTPGAVRSVVLADVCPAVDDDLDPPVPAEMKQVVFAEYNIPVQAREKEFQVDYLISPQLGGTSEISNLWPEPYSSTVWNARAKDALEERLHTMVCAGQISLAQAQHALTGDWIAAYQQFFHTESPLVSQAGMTKLDDEEFPLR